MGSRGPIPNRAADQSRARDANRGDRPELRVGEAFPVTIPDPNPDWGNVALMVWNSFQSSGQSVFWQDTDYSYAYVTCNHLNYLDQNPGARGNAMLLATVSQMMTNLMMTEGERRRARIELEQPKPEETPRHMSAVADLMDRIEG